MPKNRGFVLAKCQKSAVVCTFAAGIVLLRREGGSPPRPQETACLALGAPAGAPSARHAVSCGRGGLPPSRRRRTIPAAKVQTTADFWHFAKTKPLFFGTAGKLYKSGFGSLTFPTNRVILCSSKAKALTDQSLSALFVFLPAVRTPRSERIEGSPSGACARHMGAGARVFSFFFFPFTRCTHAGQPPPIASGGGCFAYKISRPACIFPAAVLQSL